MDSQFSLRLLAILNVLLLVSHLMMCVIVSLSALSFSVCIGTLLRVGVGGHNPTGNAPPPNVWPPLAPDKVCARCKFALSAQPLKLLHFATRG